MISFISLALKPPEWVIWLTGLGKRPFRIVILAGILQWSCRHQHSLLRTPWGWTQRMQFILEEEEKKSHTTQPGPASITNLHPSLLLFLFHRLCGSLQMELLPVLPGWSFHGAADRSAALCPGLPFRQKFPLDALHRRQDSAGRYCAGLNRCSCCVTFWLMLSPDATF